MYLSYLRGLRRSLHQIPELGFHEVRTAAFIGKELHRLGVPFREGIAKTGIVAAIKGNRKGPVVMFRADMDGLAVEEEHNLPWRSKHKGVMHACGHDGHIAVLLGLARVLKEGQKELRGTTVLVFQPAEEGGAGAKKMIEAGVLKKYVPRSSGASPKRRGTPDLFFSFHLANDKPRGFVGSRAGLQQAGARRFAVTFHGPGGHAAYLSVTKDVIKAARIFCGSLENLGRETFPWHKIPIVHVGMLQAGTAPNAVASEAVIKGTMRVQSREDLEVLSRIIALKARHIARLEDLPRPSCQFGEGYIPLVNDAEAVHLVQKVAEEHGYAFHTLLVHAGADDAAFFLDNIPGCHFKVGAKKEGAGSHHSPGFNFDEGALEVALDMYWGLAKRTMV